MGERGSAAWGRMRGSSCATQGREGAARQGRGRDATLVARYGEKEGEGEGEGGAALHRGGSNARDQGKRGRVQRLRLREGETKREIGRKKTLTFACI